MRTIRYLQLWNPLHQCQSGQPHRWVQQRPLQEIHGSGRFSRWGRCIWGGAPEHHSMTYDLEASCTSSNPLAIDALNCCHRGLVETKTGFTDAHQKPGHKLCHVCYKLQRSSSFTAARYYINVTTKKSKKIKKHQNAIVDELLPLRGQTGKISISLHENIFSSHWFILAFFPLCIVTLFCFLIQWLKFVSFFFPFLQYNCNMIFTRCARFA